MRPFNLVIASGALVAASIAPALAGPVVSFGISYGPPGYWYGPAYYPRGYYAPRYYYPRYYGVPVYGPPVYYAYAYPPRPVYVVPARPPVYVQPAPQPAPRAETRTPKKEAPMAAIPPQRFEKMTLSATELFDFDRDTLREPQPRLDEIARALKDNPSIANVRITGYTDRLGTDAYNLGLSQRRADAVKSYLMRQGVAGSRLSAIGRGEADPVVQCNQKDHGALIKCLEPNRRVEIEPITVERKVPSA